MNVSKMGWVGIILTWVMALSLIFLVWATRPSGEDLTTIPLGIAGSALIAALASLVSVAIYETSDGWP